jgi:hypothetical protein
MRQMAGLKSQVCVSDKSCSDGCESRGWLRMLTVENFERDLREFNARNECIVTAFWL